MKNAIEKTLIEACRNAKNDDELQDLMPILTAALKIALVALGLKTLERVTVNQGVKERDRGDGFLVHFGFGRCPGLGRNNSPTRDDDDRKYHEWHENHKTDLEKLERAGFKKCTRFPRPTYRTNWEIESTASWDLLG